MSRASLIFAAIMAVWSLYHGMRNQPLTSHWMGALIICELLILAQFLVGMILVLSGYWMLPRPFLYFLYAMVGIISLPAIYAYLSRQPESRAQAYGMAATCTFLFFALLRAVQVA